MNTLKYMKRLSGNYSEKDLNEDISKTRTLDVEAELLRAFSTFLRDMEGIKNRIDYPIPRFSPYGPGPIRREGKSDEKPDMELLRKIAFEKLDLVKETIEEYFGECDHEDNAIAKVKLRVSPPDSDSDDYPDDDYSDE